MDPPLRPTPPVPTVPGWALPRGVVSDDGEAAFLVGAALNALDNLVRADPPWAGVWRQRLALSAAAAAVRRAGRTEDEAALRDAWYLCQPGDDPGPAGRILAAWRRLADRAPTGEAAALHSAAALLGIGTAGLADLPGQIADLTQSRRPAPFIAASAMAQASTARPDGELLAWWLADQAIALRMRWAFPVPLLMGQAHSGLFRGPGRGGRLQPGADGFQRAVCLALVQGADAACRLAGDLAPRAARLEAVAPKLRAKGAGEAVRRLLDDDAVPGTLQTEDLSRWGARRLFERLTTLGAVRELTGRPAFRLYGL
ncbi:DUF1403 family protein [Azorhizobium sp. AG788]|uniref:DUF1403 family protein n=1 Tax=Azorhizobium sp. AG788 TaxID=2183897 RepID=UPI00313A0A5B